MTEADRILRALGPWTRFHWRIFFILGFVTLRFSWYEYGIQFVMLEDEAIVCVRPSHPSNSSSTLLGNETVLEFYERTNTTLKEQCQAVENTGCDEWMYSRTHPSSIVIEFDLVCDRSYLLKLDQEMFIIAGVFGSIILATSSDLWGRKKMLLYCFWIQGLCGVALCFSVNISMYIALKGAVGFFGPITYSTCMVLITEWFPPGNRNLPANGLQFFWPVGMAIHAGFAYLTRYSWRWHLAILSLPALISIPFWWWLPESLYMLESRGKRKQFIFWASKAANSAKKEIVLMTPSNLIDETNSSDIASNKSVLEHVIATWFKDWKFLVYSCLLWLQWSIVSFAYYLFTFGAHKMPGDPYLNYFLSGLIEIPAIAFVITFGMKFGRLPLMFGMYLFAGVTLLASTCIKIEIISIMLMTACKGSVAGVYCLQVLYGTEMFPTAVRNIGSGVSQFFEYGGNLLAPLILSNMGDPQAAFISYIATGLALITAAISTLFLRETAGCQLPDSSADVHQMPSNGVLRIFDLYMKTPNERSKDAGSLESELDSFIVSQHREDETKLSAEI